ncbi:MAG: hypothetical protein LQ343_002474 [Gyalolechia ehrenbergii]|nr:MAG: hypothetical protein LQ343_002474 [Gyalolechia ehrenbergii]
MHPLTSADLQPTLLDKKPILLLNSLVLPIRTFVRYVIADALPGAAGRLPTEIWLKIMEFIEVKDGKYEAVQPTSIVPSNGGVMLHCRVVALDFGTWDNRAEVEAAEQWLQSPHTYDQQCESEEEFIFGVKDTNKTYAISFPTALASSGASVSALRAPDCLFTAITVPDVISWLQNGRCWVCDGDRDICPGCTGGKAQEFDAFMGCGDALACPLCMGLDFMDEDNKFLQKYYWDKPPRAEAAARNARLVARWAELGYLKD